MMRKTVLALTFTVLGVTCAAAQHEVYGESFPLMFGLHGGARTSMGDNRAYEATVLDQTATGDCFVQGSFTSETLKNVIMGGTIGFTSETRLTNALSYGVDVDVGLGEQTVIGLGAGLAYNNALSEDMVWLQLKLNAAYVITTTYIGTLGWDQINVNGIDIYDPKLSISASFIIIRPELNFFYRLTTFNEGVINGLLLKTGIGYSIPIASAGQENLVFRGKNGQGESLSESVDINDKTLELKLDGKQVKKTRVSPMGASINIGICFEIL
jgi:hypothetical protein